MKKHIGGLCVAMILCVVGCCQAQQENGGYVVFDMPKTYDFASTYDNYIEYASKLQPLVEKLYQQRKAKNRMINIVHIGDSHIQADMMTEVLRASFQKGFGNAGRGLVFPHKLARSNEPLNYSITSNRGWQTAKLIQASPVVPIGLSGFSARTQDASCLLDIRVDNKFDLDYAFNKVTVFHKRDDRCFNFRLNDPRSGNITEMSALSYMGSDCSTYEYLPAQTNEVIISFKKDFAEQDGCELYGVSLENSQSGVLYHAIGCNGATYNDYVRAPHFARQLRELMPDLVIISLGTNEAHHAAPPDKEALKADIEKLVRAIEQETGSLVLLTTPAGAFWSKKTNPNTLLVRDAIVEVAQVQGIPYWDLYRLAGLEAAPANWQRNNLIQRDGVHFTEAGYAFQGYLLFDALIKEYNNYAISQP